MCISCKIMESIIASPMVSFLRSHSLISHDQFGFLARRSACMQLLATLNNWTLNVDNGMKVDVVYTDIAKAFDSVSHSKILLKVEAYGFKSNLHQWIKAFFERSHTMCIYRTWWHWFMTYCPTSNTLREISDVSSLAIPGPYCKCPLISHACVHWNVLVSFIFDHYKSGRGAC